jgi:hypothetical protein
VKNLKDIGGRGSLGGHDTKDPTMAALYDFKKRRSPCFAIYWTFPIFMVLVFRGVEVYLKSPHHGISKTWLEQVNRLLKFSQGPGNQQTSVPSDLTEAICVYGNLQLIFLVYIFGYFFAPLYGLEVFPRGNPRASHPSYQNDALLFMY